jgi:Uma2 family endonuclease
MATATFTPVEEYLAKTWHPDREYVDGEILERNLGEFPHSDLQTALSTWLRTRRRHWNVRVVVEQRVQVAPTRYRIPDVSVLSAEHPSERIITHAPLICIEVLSKDDTISSMQERFNEYSAMGVPHIWLFDPERREVWVWTANAMTKITSGVLTASGTQIAIPLEEIWSDLDWEE